MPDLVLALILIGGFVAVTSVLRALNKREP
jgi:hypothetical protein